MITPELLTALCNVIILSVFVTGVVFIILHGDYQYIKTKVLRECPLCCTNTNHYVICKRCLSHICMICYIKQFRKRCSYCRQ